MNRICKIHRNKLVHSFNKYFPNGRTRLKPEYCLALFKVPLSYDNKISDEQVINFLERNFNKLYQFYKKNSNQLIIKTDNRYGVFASYKVIWLECLNYNKIRYFRDKFKKEIYVLNNIKVESYDLIKDKQGVFRSPNEDLIKQNIFLMYFFEVPKLFGSFRHEAEFRKYVFSNQFESVIFYPVSSTDLAWCFLSENDFKKFSECVVSYRLMI